MKVYPYPAKVPDECDTSEWEEWPVSARPPEPAPVEQPKEQVDWDKYKRFMRQFR